MRNLSVIVLLLALLGLGPVARAQTVVINGKTVPMSALVQNGKLLVDAVALLKALGIAVTWDPATKKLMVASKDEPKVGTVQLPGDQAAFGATYKLGLANPLHFSLVRAEYRAERVWFGDAWVAPTADEKLLVLHYAILNPQPVETNVDWATFNFTVVDANDENHEYAQTAALENNRSKLDQFLKPAQRVEAYTVIRVPAKGVMPKLIVEPTDGKVLRYDLRGHVLPLPEPIADPADTTGATARADVPVGAGVVCPLAAFDAQLLRAAYADNLGGEQAPDGTIYLVATLRLKNQLPVPTPLAADKLAMSLRTDAGHIMPWNGDLFPAAAFTPLQVTLQPGEEIDARAVFAMPDGNAARTLRLNELPNSRAYSIDVSSAR